MVYKFGLPEALDIIEGIIAGGIIGIGTGLIASAVASSPYGFFNSSFIVPLSVLTGALAFVGISIRSIRERVEKAP